MKFKVVLIVLMLIVLAVNITPQENGTKEKPRQSIIKDDVTDCLDGTCTATLGKVRFAPYQEEWYEIEKAPSLKESSRIKCVVDSDNIHIAECVDYNYTHRLIKTNINEVSLSNVDVPVKVLKVNASFNLKVFNKTYKDLPKEEYEALLKEEKYIVVSEKNYNFKDTKEIKQEWIKASYNEIIEIGESSTTIKLVTLGSDFLGSRSFTDSEYRAWQPEMKFNISNITKIPNQVIDEAKLVLFSNGDNYLSDCLGIDALCTEINDALCEGNQECCDYFGCASCTSGTSSWTCAELEYELEECPTYFTACSEDVYDNIGNISFYRVLETNITLYPGISSYDDINAQTYGVVKNLTDYNFTCSDKEMKTFDITELISDDYDNGYNASTFRIKEGSDAFVVAIDQISDVWNFPENYDDGYFVSDYNLEGYEPYLNITYSEADTCSCPASGNWYIDCSDNCVIEDNCNMQGNDVHTYGTGSLTITTGKIYNFGLLANRCTLVCRNTGGCFG